jgi:pimeloyl-ACP methyl ester carboxylesterase
MTMLKFAVALLSLASLHLAAADRLISVETRPGVRVAYWMMERPDATATVMLLPGGEGGIGMKDGVPTSSNFLVRSRDLFAAAGYNVAIVGKPSDRTDLDPGFRASSDHVTDLRRIAEKLRKDFGKPVWLVGTSLGTISAAATAIAMDPGEIAGIVLSSSRTGGGYPTVPGLALSKIRVPVLVMHNRDDACPSCDPREAARITASLTNAPVKRFVLIEGGSGARGPPCEAFHYHGYIGMEKEAVETITAWMKDPKDL